MQFWPADKIWIWLAKYLSINDKDLVVKEKITKD